ncbi:uncharacterized protein M421DRAFT_99565 [Didymella exigua CBS 183.55]|uniref:N-acetyltransferase domain-containing protein n=1 Tax=Didymella exigua CBS 183.55 TaxID=1150837 RepID=A0A6A5RVL4_9PLEO|nr:uncharacterized protein M421DRAFT_99565 [Didymella exigua CBS 183.55]KAF1931018.1 hypothetical protein M421DRAFT_99565 [Didymella exigua CBS 183.55]
MSSSFTFETIPAAQVTGTMLEQAAALFSDAYGVWGPDAADKMGKFCKPVTSTHVKMSVERLREQSLAPDTNSVLVRAMTGDKLAGYAFICWVTQLCVSYEYRRQKLATRIMLRLREGEHDRGFGFLSSHPAEHAAGIMAASPVEYVRNAQLKRSVFGIDNGSVCCANTDFLVDHAEPLAALAEVKKKVHWPFGELPEGCEFLVLIKGAGVSK